MKKEIYTICFDNEIEFKQAMELLDNNNLDFLYSKVILGKPKTIENIRVKQESDMMLAFDKYYYLSQQQRNQNYKVPKEIAKYTALVPKTFLRKHLRLRASFKNYEKGIENGLEETIDRMLLSGIISEINLDQRIRELGTTSPIYIKTEYLPK